jgi:hypothetical protein
VEREVRLHTSLSVTLQKVVRFEVFTAVTMKNVVFWDKKKPTSDFTGDT